MWRKMMELRQPSLGRVCHCDVLRFCFHACVPLSVCANVNHVDGECREHDGVSFAQFVIDKTCLAMLLCCGSVSWLLAVT